ncbi:hypothetical protein QUB60_13130 [Microcoleus sp. A2-C5]|uniref:hypothetical protein n=1 Tax=Microcoleaceae TaxID=1892252 RepID=UPI00223860FB|nr:hypothetical protein [Lyngbya sp. CCAP 1446/10]MCW6049245.1 hypothetical protein [Lyngbya sp. CCAP 1446/10]
MQLFRAIAHAGNSCCDRLEEEESYPSYVSAPQPWRKQTLPQCSTSVSDYQHNRGNTASLFPRFPT